MNWSHCAYRANALAHSQCPQPSPAHLQSSALVHSPTTPLLAHNVHGWVVWIPTPDLPPLPSGPPDPERLPVLFLPSFSHQGLSSCCKASSNNNISKECVNTHQDWWAHRECGTGSSKMGSQCGENSEATCNCHLLAKEKFVFLTPCPAVEPNTTKLGGNSVAYHFA